MRLTVLVALLLVTPLLLAPTAEAQTATQEALAPADDVASLLNQCPCAPTDFELYSSQAYGADLPLFDAPDPGLIDAQLERAVRRQLVHYLRRHDPLLVGEGMRLYHDDDVREVVADPRLRGALILLLGTPGEPAIDWLLDKSRETTVEFAPASELRSAEAVAEAFIPSADRFIVKFNDRFQHESLPLLTPIVLHESLHQDPADVGFRREEETTLRLLHALVLTHMVAEFPEITDAKTELLRGQLTQTLALVFNSITALEGRGDTILPGATVQVDDFYTQGPVQTIPEGTTPGNQLLVDALDRYGYAFADIPDFSKDLLAQLVIPDMASAALTVEELLTAAEAMTLEPASNS